MTDTPITGGTKLTKTNGPAIAGGLAIPDATESNLMKYGLMHRWWSMDKNRGMELYDPDTGTPLTSPRIVCRKTRSLLVPVHAGQLPVAQADGGPDNLARLQFGLNAQVDALISDDTGLPGTYMPTLPGGTISQVIIGKHGSTTTCTASCWEGNNGGGLDIQWRSSDLDRMLTTNDANTNTQRVSQTIPATPFVGFNIYNDSTHTLSEYSNGTLLSGLTPSDGTYEPQTLTYPSSRFVLGGHHDVTDGDGGVISTGFECSEVLLFRCDLSTDTVAYGLLKAWLAYQAPTLAAAMA